MFLFLKKFMSKLLDLIEKNAILHSQESMKSPSTSSGGLSFTGALTILFIGLKLGNVIHWSWWWVLSPIIISIAILCILALLIGAIILEMKK
jgi:hypothetical protein